MAIIQFSNGTKVNFNGNPTQADIEEVANKLGINQAPTTNNVPQKSGGMFSKLGVAGSTKIKPLSVDLSGDPNGSMLKGAALGLGQGLKVIPNIAIGAYNMTAGQTGDILKNVWESGKTLAGAKKEGVLGQTIKNIPGAASSLEGNFLESLAGVPQGSLAGSGLSGVGKTITGIGSRIAKSVGGAVNSFMNDPLSATLSGATKVSQALNEHPFETAVAFKTSFDQLKAHAVATNNTELLKKLDTIDNVITKTGDAVIDTATGAAKSVVGGTARTLLGDKTVDTVAENYKNPKLVQQYRSGEKNLDTLSQQLKDETSAFQKKSISEYNAVKNQLPDTPVDQEAITQNIQNRIKDITGLSPEEKLNLSQTSLSSQEQTLVERLTNKVDGWKNWTNRGVIDLRQSIDKGGFYKGTEDFGTSDKIVGALRQELNSAAISGGNEQFAGALETASKNIDFLDKVKATLIGSGDNVETTANRIRALLPKLDDPIERRATFDLIQQLDSANGTNMLEEMRAATAARTLSAPIPGATKPLQAIQQGSNKILSAGARGISNTETAVGNLPGNIEGAVSKAFDGLANTPNKQGGFINIGNVTKAAEYDPSVPISEQLSKGIKFYSYDGGPTGQQYGAFKDAIPGSGAVMGPNTISVAMDPVSSKGVYGDIGSQGVLPKSLNVLEPGNKLYTEITSYGNPMAEALKKGYNAILHEADGGNGWWMAIDKSQAESGPLKALLNIKSQISKVSGQGAMAARDPFKAGGTTALNQGANEAIDNYNKVLDGLTRSPAHMKLRTQIQAEIAKLEKTMASETKKIVTPAVKFLRKTNGQYNGSKKI